MVIPVRWLTGADSFLPMGAVAEPPVWLKPLQSHLQGLPVTLEWNRVRVSEMRRGKPFRYWVDEIRIAHETMQRDVLLHRHLIQTPGAAEFIVISDSDFSKLLREVVDSVAQGVGLPEALEPEMGAWGRLITVEDWETYHRQVAEKKPRN